MVIVRTLPFVWAGAVIVVQVFRSVLLCGTQSDLAAGQESLIPPAEPSISKPGIDKAARPSRPELMHLPAVPAE